MWAQGCSYGIFNTFPSASKFSVEFGATEVVNNWDVQIVETRDEAPALAVLEAQEKLLSSGSNKRTVGKATCQIGALLAEGVPKDEAATALAIAAEEEAKEKKAVDSQRSSELLDAILANDNDLDLFKAFPEFVPPDQAGMTTLHCEKEEDATSATTLLLEMIAPLSSEANERPGGDMFIAQSLGEGLLDGVDRAPRQAKSKSGPKTAANPFSEYESLTAFIQDDFGEQTCDKEWDEEIERGAGFVTEQQDMTRKGFEADHAGAFPSSGSFAPQTEWKLEVVPSDDKEAQSENNDENDADIDALLSIPLLHTETKDPSSSSSAMTSGATSRRHASTTPLSLDEFESLRPRMAMQFPFELDMFQKQAIMRLERRECVFVAAHTSAGKTVVAEYAIALAQRHKSRCIYTSPIKALSNQKYRDFKERFDDVGILTGDVSVNPDASCLIMTTEILRSMLYRGADAIRDIEWVIFDEVHYVNDSERGVVWEEVIIMLPDRINLIFLSATSPNTVDFSDWIGRTKRRKVHITATNKRPVPLQHFLYHEEEVYKLRHGDGPFESNGVVAAVKRVREKAKAKEKTSENKRMQAQRQNEKAHNAAVARGGRATPGRGSCGRGGGRGTSAVAVRRPGDIGGSQSQWVALLNLLKTGGREAHRGRAQVDFGVGFGKGFQSAAARTERETMVPYENLPANLRAVTTREEYEDVRGDDDEEEVGRDGLLPLVIFSFSKRKCEEVADFFRNQELLSAREKAGVARVVALALVRLTPVDRRLPQVRRMVEMLKRGIGVHHGGLLPLMKEMVEVLFSRGIVKVLLATETFAMGVNMPARSVIFNGYRKHDGTTFRDLLPGEYTQMAGRAGRRGLDALGTVLVVSWGDVPKEAELKRLLTGRPTRLSSQFRLTYNMILNLLRVNGLSVEDMIQRSFSEFHTQRSISTTQLIPKLRRCDAAATKAHTRCVRACEESGFANGDVEALRIYVDEVVRARETCRQQMVYLRERARASDLRTLLCQGRRVLVLLDEIACPVPAILLSEPVATLAPDQGSKFGVDATEVTVDGASAKVASVRAMHAWALFLIPAGVEISTAATAAAAATAINGSTSSASAEEGGKMSSKTVRKGDIPVDSEHAPPTWEERYGPIHQASSSENDNEGEEVDIRGSRFWVRRVSLADVVFIGNECSPGPGDCTVKGNSDDHDGDDTGNRMLRFGHIQLSPCVLALLDSGIGDHLVNAARQLRITDFDFTCRQIALAETWNLVNATSADHHMQVPDGSLFALAYKEWRLRRKIRYIRFYISSENTALFTEFQMRLSVLWHLGYVEGEAGAPVASLKGRVTSEINSADELLTSECILGNLFEPLNPPEAVAMLSAFVFQEKSDDYSELPPRMEVCRAQMLAVQKNLLDLQEALGVDGGAVADPRSRLNFGLAAVTYEWARGKPFNDIAAMTMCAEGTIVRTITRLDELCKDVRNAARVMGNAHLYRKMEAASQCIKRDIVFAASLYI